MTEMSLFGNGSNGVFGISNAYNYAKSYVNSLKSSGQLNTNAFKSINTAQNIINSTNSDNSLFTAQNNTNLSQLKSAASALSSAVKSLNKNPGQLVSSDNNVIKSNSQLFSRNEVKFDVSVNRLATAQKTQSSAVDSFANSGFSTGKNSFRLLTETGSYDISFNVGNKDNNQTALNSIANSINSTQSGITASVINENGKSRLQMTSDKTGNMSAFALEDINGGNTINRMNLETTQSAQNSSYTVNGKNYNSENNTVAVDGERGATMTLTGQGKATLSRGVDSTKVVAAAQNFAAAYNNAMTYLSSGKANGAGVSQALSLIANNRMTNLSASQYGSGASTRLDNMGISVDQNGKMQIDAKKLSAAAQKSPSTIQSALIGYGGLADVTKQNAEEAMRIPKAKYTDFNKMGVENNLINSLMPKTGSIFDLLK